MSVLQNPNKIRIITNSDAFELCGCTSASIDDINIEYKSGVLSVAADVTGLKFIEIEWTADFMKGAKVLGDAFERSYGDLEWKDAEATGKIPWYFLAAAKDRVYGTGVKTGANSFCHFKYNDGIITLCCDIRSASEPVFLGGRKLDICNVISEVYTEPAFDAAKSFCKLMCDNPRYISKPIFGGNDWYCNYGDNSYEKIINQGKIMAECAKNCPEKPYMIIDSGWQKCVFAEFNGGPWNQPNMKFGDMKRLAEELKAEGLVPGIWFRPLLSCEYMPNKCYMPHPDKNNIGCNLDPTDEDVLDMVTATVKTIKNWGYELIKHDFTTYDITGKYGFEMTGDTFAEGMKFADNTRTTAEVIKNLYRVIRDAAGDDMVIIGCNTIGHLAAGYFEIQRTGDDTSGFDWNTTRKMGINTLAFRLPQDKTFYNVDADCVGIMGKIPWEKNKQWLDLLANSRTALLVSVNDKYLTDEIKNDISKAFETISSGVTEEPLDWTETRTPSKWKTSDGDVHIYNWQ